MKYKYFKLKTECPNCKISILQFKRKATGELKLYCRLCKSFTNLPKEITKELRKKIPIITEKGKRANCVLKKRKEKFFNLNKGKKKMSKNKKNKNLINEISSEQVCRNCGNFLKIRKYKKLPVKLLKQSYYFSEWTFCWKCNSVFFKEQNKVFLTKEMKEKIERGFDGKNFVPNPTNSLFAKKKKERKVFNSMYREMKMDETNFLNNLQPLAKKEWLK